MTLDLNIAGGTSDMGFQVWTAVRLGISSLNSCQTSDPRAHESKIQDPRCSKNFSWIQGRNPGFGSKIQDVEKLVLENLGSTNPNWIQDFCPGSTKSFLNILNLGAWIRIQDVCPGSKKKKWTSWILDIGSLQCQTWDVQVWTGVKTKHELQTKTVSKKSWCLSCVALSRFCCNAHPHPLRVAAVSSARYCIILNLVVHHPGKCLFFADVLMVLSTLSESYLKP